MPGKPAIFRQETNRGSCSLEELADKNLLHRSVINGELRITDCNNGFMKLFSLSEKPLGVALGEGVTFEEGRQEFRCNPSSYGRGVLVAHRIPYENGLLLWCERPLNDSNQVVEEMTRLNNEYCHTARAYQKKPSVEANEARTGRSEKACRSYFCPTTKRLPGVYKSILRGTIDNCYDFGLIVTGGVWGRVFA